MKRKTFINHLVDCYS